MRPRRALGKVTAYITRPAGGATELLLFRHPTAGIQVPAGTVEIGEPVEAAARREAREESGLDGLRLVRPLGAQIIRLPPDVRAVVRATKLFDAPAPDASTTGVHCGRGAYLRYVRSIGAYAEVIREADESVGEEEVTGFVRESVLTGQLERHHFHFTPDAPTPPAWEVWTDGRLFRLFWQPLAPAMGLASPQDEWLTFVYEALRQSAGD
jgi:8-oxo-dGTP pyrophosphatase MutT (NUDIX family)